LLHCEGLKLIAAGLSDNSVGSQYGNYLSIMRPITIGVAHNMTSMSNGSDPQPIHASVMSIQLTVSSVCSGQCL